MPPKSFSLAATNAANNTPPTAYALRHIFGFRADVHDSVHFPDDGVILFVAGHNVVLHTAETKQQRFIPGTVDSDGITALAIAPQRKLLAVAEKAEKAMVTVYDLAALKRRKVLLSADAGSREYVSMSFSPDGKWLVTQGGAPDWHLLLWQWEKAKVTAVVKASNQ